MELVFLLSLLLGLLRFAGVKSIAFQAIAHLWVGGLVGASVYSKEGYRVGFILLAVLLTVAEVVAFFILK